MAFGAGKAQNKGNVHMKGRIVAGKLEESIAEEYFSRSLSHSQAASGSEKWRGAEESSFVERDASCFLVWWPWGQAWVWTAVPSPETVSGPEGACVRNRGRG